MKVGNEQWRNTITQERDLLKDDKILRQCGILGGRLDKEKSNWTERQRISKKWVTKPDI